MGYTSAFSDVINSEFIASNITVGTSQVIAKVGASNLARRQEVTIYNRSDNTIWYGPSGVTINTGVPIQSGETISLQYGDTLDIYLVSDVAGNTVTIQEGA